MDNTRLIELENRMAEITAILESRERDNVNLDELLLTTGQMLAEAEFILAKKRAEVLSDLINRKPTMSANEQKVQVEAKSAREAKLARQIMETNKALGIIVANRRRN